MMFCRHKLCCVLHLGLLVAPGLGLRAGDSTAPSSAAAIPPYNVRVWQTDDGLPQNSVYALAQTADGYLWVGTRGGLARFNGVHFEPVDELGAPELKQGWITALCCTRDGSLWIACEGHGLTRLQRGVFLHFGTESGLPGTQPRTLVEARDGSLWVGSEGGLSHFENGRFRTFTQKDGLGDDSVRAIWEDQAGRLRIATKRGLSSLRPGGKITNENLGTNWTANALRAVYEDRSGRLWVGSTDGLTSVEGGRRRVYGVADGLPDRIINAVYEDRSRQVWLGTYGGLACIVDGQVVPPRRRSQLLGDLVYTLLEDREGSLWVGARDGLFRLTPARFTTYTTENGLTRNNVMSVCEDRAGKIWLGIWDGGLNLLDEGRVTAYAATNQLTRDSVLSICAGSDGAVWMGLDFDGGLERLQEGRRISLPRLPGSLAAPVFAIHEDRRGDHWIATGKGLNILRQGSLQTYTSTNGLAGDVVRVVAEAADGAVWIGTEGGLSRWRDGRFDSFTTRDGLSHRIVDALLEDQQGTLWIGTRGGGLNRFKDGKFTAYTTKQGLFSDEIFEIVEDDFGYFWMSCRRGIFRVSRKELEEFDHGGAKGITCTVFGKADGLQSVQCNGVAKPAGWKGRDGRLWFATIRGVVAVDSRIKTNEEPPPVLIEEVVTDGNRLALDSWKMLGASGATADGPAETHGSGRAGTELRIPPGKGELEIRYAALSFQAPEKIQFKYRMEGLDLDWVDAGPQRSARYNHVQPGTYRFRVIACNNDGVWNEAGATLGLVWLPHFWQTWWFKALVALPFAAALWLLHRFRVNRFRELERLRMDIAANLHDDVGSRLTKVLMISEHVDQETPDANPLKPHVSALFATSRDIVRAIDEIVWTINPKNDTVDQLASYVFQYAQEYFQNTGVRCRIDMPSQLPDYTVSTEARHNLFMAVKEALANVLKHARASEVHVGLDVQDGRLRIEISDNGSGFSTAVARASANGLKNMRERLEQLGGSFGLTTGAGAGTKVVLETGTL